MSEQLGEAVLVLRTDDTRLEPGMRKAKAGADSVGAAFDKTRGKAAQLAPELTKTGNAAAGAGAQFAKAGQQVNTSAGAQRAGMQQLGAQLGDMATMYSLGARPMQIFASQIGQVTGAMQLALGGTSKFAAFLTGPWGIALSVGAIVLVPLIGKLFETEEAMGKVEFASSAMADAQGILGNVVDLTTGKINNQSKALLGLAKAQALAGQIDARRKMAAARSQLAEQGAGADFTFRPSFGPAGRIGVARNAGDVMTAGVKSAVLDGSLRYDEAISSLESMLRVGQITEAQLLETAESIVQLGVEGENLKIFQDLSKALKGDTKALQQFLNPGREKKGPREPKGPKGPKDRTAEIADRQASEIARLEREELQAKLDLATDVQDRAAIQGDLLNLERNERVRQIEADKDLSKAQKDAQIAYIDRLYGKTELAPDGSITVAGGNSLLGQALSRETREREAALANDALARQAAALDAQAGITTKLEERDGLERRALELQQQIEANLLEQDIANGRVADADQARALLAEQQAAHRQQQMKGQLGPMDRYREDLRTTVENIDTHFEQVQVDGIQAFSDGIVDAIVNMKSLGDVARNVLKQILADMIRLQITKMLFNIIGGGMGGGPSAALVGDVTSTMANPQFAGLFASGGRIAPGEWGIVGERGPEPVIGTSRGAMVLPNRTMRDLDGAGGGTTVNNTINVPARADPRRTQSSVARGTQVGLARATRKGIAAPAGSYS